jgi:hypothetical protein
VDPEDSLCLAFDNGEPFQGLGVNTRSPTDARHEKMVPHNLWRDEGLNFYRRVFPTYRKRGINVAEVWMSSWWLALEWIPDAPGNHGVGHYNQYRAWLLDRLMECAEENGVYIILVIHNHGKFSTFCDREWSRNPYNRANGGYLAHNESYFTDKRAKEDFRNMADYLVARWGHSPHLLTWKLFSEINLTGASHGFYRTSAMEDWHREMAQYLHEIDIYDHMVTTHWSSNYTLINRPIASLETLDILTTDAYTDNFGKTEQMVKYLEGGYDYAGDIGKPLVITEFGGDPLGDSLGVLRRQLRLGHWSGYFGKSAILPMMWWFAIIDEEDFYDDYSAISAYIEGEELRGMERGSRSLPEVDLELRTLRGRGRTLLWGYDPDYFHSAVEARKPPPREGLTVDVGDLSPGDYVVEHWSCATGEIVRKSSLQVEAGSSTRLAIPPFAGDFAVKIVPAE